MDVIGRFCKIYTDICQISPDDLEHIYADDILFIDPITTHHGIDEVKRYFSNLLTQAESCKFDIADIFTCSPNGSKEHPSSHSKVTHFDHRQSLDNRCLQPLLLMLYQYPMWRQ